MTFEQALSVGPKGATPMLQTDNGIHLNDPGYMQRCDEQLLIRLGGED